MRFKFYSKESKLYDFLQFPGLIYYREEYEKLEEDDIYKELSAESYLNFVKTVEDRLIPFKSDIEIFYGKQDLSEYDFINLIFKVNNIFGYEDTNDYLNMLLNLNDQEINRSIVYSMITSKEDYSAFSEEAFKKAEEISVNKDKLISFIKDLPADGAVKWNLFMIAEEPVKHMKKYVDLMNKLLPIFEEIYLSYKDEVNNYGKYLVDFLNENGAKGLDEITYSIVDAKLIDNEENNILISKISSYTIRLMSTTKIPYIAWGLKIEDAIKKIKEINENKINERVQVFKNLGDKTRYEVVRLIASGESSIKEMAEILGVTSATISYHINNLVTSKIIKLDKTDNRYGYIVDYELLERTMKEFKEDIVSSQKGVRPHFRN